MKVHEFKQYVAKTVLEDVVVGTTEGDIIPELCTFLVHYFNDDICALQVECVLKRRQRTDQWLSKLENYVSNRYDILKAHLRKKLPDFNMTAVEFCLWFFETVHPEMIVSTDGKTLMFVWNNAVLH